MDHCRYYLKINEIKYKFVLLNFTIFISSYDMSKLLISKEISKILFFKFYFTDILLGCYKIVIYSY